MKTFAYIFYIKLKRKTNWLSEILIKNHWTFFFWNKRIFHRNFKEKLIFFRGAHGIVVVYDVTDQKTFTSVQKWLLEIERYACKNVPIVLVGNKADLDSARKVTKEEGTLFADQHSLAFFETSAKNSTNVESAFSTLSSLIKEKLEE